MTTSLITLTDQQLAALQVIAQQVGKTEDELVQVAVEHFIRQFQHASLSQGSEVESEPIALNTTIASAAKPTTRKRRPRQGWDAQFKAMAANGDDQLPEWGTHSLTTWDQDEWEW